MSNHHRRTRKDLTRRRNRTMRGLEASGSVAVVGCLVATGLIAGALATDATASAEDTPLAVIEPSQAARPSKPTPRPTKTVITYKTILVTPSPKPPVPAQGGSSGGWTSSGSTSSTSNGSGSSWTPARAATPVRAATKAPTKPKPQPPAPAPKPSATSGGS